MVQKFHENVENYVNVNFRAKNCVIARGETTPTAEQSKFLWEEFLWLDV